MKGGSLERRLLWRLVLGVGVALGLAGIFLVGGVERRARGDFDRLLGDRARAIASLAEQENGQVWLEFDPAAYPEFLPKTGGEYFEFRDGDGRSLSNSAGAGKSLPVRSVLPGESNPRFADIELPDGRPGRVVVFRFTPRLEHPGEQAGAEPPLEDLPEGALRTREQGSRLPASPQEAEILVARERGSLDSFLARVRSTSLSSFTALLLGLVVLIGWSLRAELGRVRSLADSLNSVDASSLGRPLGQVSLPSELQPVVVRIDQLLQRLHASFAREREFSTQLAHELRTPLAEMRTSIDVALRWPDSREVLVETLEEVRTIGTQMENLLGNLLAVARADSGIEPMRSEQLALADELGRVLAGLRPRFEARAISVRNRVSTSDLVAAPPAVLGLLLRNLAANGADHAAPGTWLEVSFDHAAGALTFRNPAGGLHVDDLPKLFERFWRKRTERSLGEHAGLGLALVRSLARGLGGDAVAHLENGELSIVVTGLRGSRMAQPASR